jgi:hypothetical protein
LAFYLNFYDQPAATYIWKEYSVPINVYE